MITKIEVANKKTTIYYESTTNLGLNYRLEYPYIFIEEIDDIGTKILAVLQKDYSIIKITYD